MKLLFIGDIFGKVGRNCVKTHLQSAREHFGIDCVVANAENSAHGFGLTKSTAKELFGAGVDVLTGGNHTWDKPEVGELFDTTNTLRPLNYSPVLPGRGFLIFECADGQKVAIINSMGHFGMPSVDNVLLKSEEAVNILIDSGIKNIFIDFHAESTSEKYAFLHYFCGKVSAIAGTHTHVGTDDLMILNGTGFVSDVGMSGARSGVIGVEKEAPIRRLMTGVQDKLKTPDKAPSIFQAIIFEFNDGICEKAFKIKAYDNEEPFISQEAKFESF